MHKEPGVQPREVVLHRLTDLKEMRFLPESLEYRLVPCLLHAWEALLCDLGLEHSFAFEIKNFKVSNSKVQYGPPLLIGMHFYQMAAPLSFLFPLDFSECQ